MSCAPLLKLNDGRTMPQLSSEDMAILEGLDGPLGRIGPDPESF